MTKARDIADGTRYVDVTGDTMTGVLNVTAPGDASTGSLNINATDPFIRFYDSNGTTDARKWDVRVVGNTEGFVVRSVNDANTSFATRLAVDPSGRVTMPYQPVFRARLGSVINNPSGQVITFTVSQLDTGNNYSTSNSRFTAPVAGKYFFGVRFYASIRSGGLRVLHNHWRVNGGNTLDATMGGGTGGDGGYSAHPTLTDTCILYLSAGDYVEFYNASRSSTGDFDLEDGYFYGHLIG